MRQKGKFSSLLYAFIIIVHLLSLNPYSKEYRFTLLRTCFCWPGNGDCQVRGPAEKGQKSGPGQVQRRAEGGGGNYNKVVSSLLLVK